VQFENVRAGALNVNAGTVGISAKASAGSASGTSVVSSLNIGASAAVDVGNNDLAIDYTGDSPLATIASQIQTGYSAGACTGAGINSSSAAAAAGAHATGLGYGEASAILGPTGGDYSGQPVDGSAVLIRYTYSGDANLDRTVDTVDFNLLATNFSQGGKGWMDGDFNYDGIVDTIDFNQLAANFSLTLATAPGLGAVVPEPSSTGLLVVVQSGLLLSRGRRNRAATS
jgi:hypothetical protein